MQSPTPSWVRALAVAAALVFLGALVLFAVRDRLAEDRCRDLGGQTWDSGRHCTVGGRVMDTR